MNDYGGWSRQSLYVTIQRKVRTPSKQGTLEDHYDQSRRAKAHG